MEWLLTLPETVPTEDAVKYATGVAGMLALWLARSTWAWWRRPTTLAPLARDILAQLDRGATTGRPCGYPNGTEKWTTGPLEVVISPNGHLEQVKIGGDGVLRMLSRADRWAIVAKTQAHVRAARERQEEDAVATARAKLARSDE